MAGSGFVRELVPRLACVALAALAFVTALGGRAEAQEAGSPGADSPPVLLRKSLLLTPAEAAGTGVAPEVRVRIAVDARGRVERVEVLSIEPSSEYDEVFRRAVEEELSAWRYAPARKAGEPVAATLEWTIGFRAAERRSEDPAAHPSSSAFPAGAIADAAAVRSRIFALPPEKQAEILRRHASGAEARLAAPTRRRADSDRFVVVTDAPDEETAEVVAGNLESVFALLDQTYGPALGLQGTPYKLLVYVYWTKAAFDAAADALGRPEWADGLYAAPGIFAFHLDVEHAEYLLGLMVHEAVHAYMDRHLMRPGVAPPPWFSEGLAEYYGNSEIRRGRLVPGSVREGKYLLTPGGGGAYRFRTDSGWTLDQVRRAVRKGEALTAAELVAMDWQAFYGEDDLSLRYALAWLLVHFLRHGEDGWAEEEFPALVLYLAEGYPAGAAIEAAYGRALRELEEPFRKHVASF